MSDEKTLNVYAEAAEQYASGVAELSDADQQEDLNAFVSYLPSDAPVLDLGCGPGQWAARLRKRGLTVEATDASPEMAAYAKEHHEIDARVATFDMLDADGYYAGIWANFSLLHAPKLELPAHLKRIHTALCPKGVFHIGTKLGNGESRDRLGRFFAYYQADELKTLLKDAGFHVLRSRTGKGKGLSGEVSDFIVITAHA